MVDQSGGVTHWEGERGAERMVRIWSIRVALRHTMKAKKALSGWCGVQHSSGIVTHNERMKASETLSGRCDVRAVHPTVVLVSTLLLLLQ